MDFYDREKEIADLRKIEEKSKNNAFQILAATGIVKEKTKLILLPSMKWKNGCVFVK